MWLDTISRDIRYDEEVKIFFLKKGFYRDAKNTNASSAPVCNII